MNTAAARTSVKNRLDIESSTNTFDTVIDEFVLSSVKRLYPIAQREIAAQLVTANVDSFGEAIVDLSTLTVPCQAARKVEYRTPDGAWVPATDTFHHGVGLTVRSLPSYAREFKIYGVTTFALDTVPEYLELAVIWFAMSEFYDFLAGNQAKYNIYMQSGARNVDNMNDEAINYEQKANAYLNDRVQLYGTI